MPCRIILFLAAFAEINCQGQPAANYHVVHGWPALPENYVLGQVPGVAVDSHNHVFVFQRGDHYAGPNRTSKIDEPIREATVFCFDGKTGALVTSWGDNLFWMPHGLRVDADDNLWFTDVGTHQVTKFSHDGKLLLTMGEKGKPGLDGRHFNKPTDIAFAADGSFYVSDGYGNSRVARFSRQGEFLMDWGKKGDKPGEFNLPHGIATDRQGRVYVADRSNARVQVFDGNGKYLQEWKSASLGRPWAVSVGPDDSVYVVDGGDLTPRPPDRAHLLKLDLQGHIVEKWARYGNYDGQLYWPHAVAVGKDGEVYVGEIIGMRVQKFSKRK